MESSELDPKMLDLPLSLAEARLHEINQRISVLEAEFSRVKDAHEQLLIPLQAEKMGIASVITHYKEAIEGLLNKINVGASDTEPLQEIEILGLTLRTQNVLKAEDIKFVGQLTRRTRNELLMTKNLGKRSVSEIEEALAIKNLSLRK